MKRFRMRNNVPDPYVKQSRDFQLMCDLFDIINNGIKFDIDTITDLSDTTLCRESMLPYLSGKLGLELTTQIPSDSLRTILKCFPYVVNHKGSRRGIEEAICLFLNVIYANCDHRIEITNRSAINKISGYYIIKIDLEDNVLKNLHILDDILKYVLPSGYKLEYDLKYSVDDIVNNIYPLDSVNITFVNEHRASKPRQSFAIQDGNNVFDRKTYDNPNTNEKLPGVIGAVGTTLITAKTSPYLNKIENTLIRNEVTIKEDSRSGGFFTKEITENESNK